VQNCRDSIVELELSYKIGYKRSRQKFPVDFSHWQKLENIHYHLTKCKENIGGENSKVDPECQ
jgi:hypothetical protein